MGERVLLAGGTEKSRELLQTLAAPGSWECCKLCHSGGETRRALGEGEWSLLIINTPLGDESGLELAMEAAGRTMAAVLLRLKKLPHAPHKLFSFRLLEKISLIAIPSILQQSFVSVGNIFIQGIVNTFGTTTIAGYAAAVKVNNFAVTSLNTLGNAMSTYTAQNIGAGKIPRVKAGGRAGMAIGLSISAALAVLYVLLRSVLVGAFLENPVGATLEEGMRFLLIVSPFFPILAVKLVSDGMLRGAGVMRYFMISTFTDLVLRVVLAKVFSDLMATSTGIWLAWPVGWIVATAISATFYLRGVWDKEKAEKEADAAAV